MMRTLIVAAALLTSAPAFADAALAFREGRFAEAVRLGRAEATAPALVYAGRAALMIAGFEATDRLTAKATIDLAERDFANAVAKAPNNLEARTQKAIAMGYRAKLDKSPGEGKDARQQMEAVLSRDPNYPLANAALGGWHGGAVATLGPFLASTLLGANRKAMDTYFATAMARDPKSIVHPVTYAVTLLEIDAGNAAKAATLLRGAVALPVRDAFDAENRKAAVQVLAKLTANDAKGARALAKRLSPFGAI